MAEQNQIDFYEFKPIPSQHGYECNRMGQVRKIGKTNPNRLSLDKNGYLNTTCNGQTYYVHRLVAETFVPNPDHAPNVEHINNNKTDNYYKNLRWCYKSRNMFNRNMGNEVTEIPEEAVQIYVIKNHTFKDLFYYNQCFYVDYGFKIRCYRGCIVGNQKRWQICDVNDHRITFSSKQFLAWWPQFKDDF